MRSFDRDANYYRRGIQRFPPSENKFLIVTEGEKTEPHYFKALRNRLHLSAVDVEIVHPEGTDPITLTKYAIDRMDERMQRAKNTMMVPYDEVWVVCDLEKTHDHRRELAKKAKILGAARNIKFAFSDPCFEFWLLIHFEKTTTPSLTACSKAYDKLKKHLPKYEKGKFPGDNILDKLPIAVSNARFCRQHHQACSGDGNPSTDIDLLVHKLNMATRDHFRFSLPQ